MLVSNFFIFDDKYFVVLQYTDIPFKYRHLYHDKKYRSSLVHRCIIATLVNVWVSVVLKRTVGD